MILPRSQISQMEELELKHGIFDYKCFLHSTILCYPNEWIHSKHSTRAERAVGKDIFSSGAKGTKESQVSVPGMT